MVLYKDELVATTIPPVRRRSERALLLATWEEPWLMQCNSHTPGALARTCSLSLPLQNQC